MLILTGFRHFSGQPAASVQWPMLRTEPADILSRHPPAALVGQFAISLFISHKRLIRYKHLPKARCHWALDSGAFSERNWIGSAASCRFRGMRCAAFPASGCWVWFSTGGRGVSGCMR